MGKFKKVLILSTVIIIIAALAVLFSYRFMGDVFSNDPSAPDVKAKSGEQSSEIGPYQSLGEFLVNTSQNMSYQFIKASIVVEVDDKAVLEELEKRDPQIRDLVITILREDGPATMDESDASGLKKKIKEALNKVLLKGKITSVWFTEYVVQ